jgi:aryl-alcohol dehydrogenase-like predicted oxidoreductase
MLKLALGTVQFGLPYGINNKTGIPSCSEIENILKYAKQNGLNILDTASAYGNVEEKLGRILLNNFKIVGKFSKVINPKELEEQLKKTLDDLKSKNLYAYLAHSSKDLIKNPTLWEYLIKKKEEGVVNKIGVSLYNPIELDELEKINIFPDIVQIPFSLLDRKFESILPYLKQKSIEVHSRSVFLQGLYFKPLNNLPPKLFPLREQLNQLLNLSNEFELPIRELALKFVLENRNIDKVVIGVDSLSQLKENIQIVKSPILPNKLIAKVNCIKVTDLDLLNPANW